MFGNITRTCDEGAPALKRGRIGGNRDDLTGIDLNANLPEKLFSPTKVEGRRQTFGRLNVFPIFEATNFTVRIVLLQWNVNCLERPD